MSSFNRAHLTWLTIQLSLVSFLLVEEPIHFGTGQTTGNATALVVTGLSQSPLSSIGGGSVDNVFAESSSALSTQGASQRTPMLLYYPELSSRFPVALSPESALAVASWQQRLFVELTVDGCRTNAGNGRTLSTTARDASLNVTLRKSDLDSLFAVNTTIATVRGDAPCNRCPTEAFSFSSSVSFPSLCLYVSVPFASSPSKTTGAAVATPSPLLSRWIPLHVPLTPITMSLDGRRLSSSSDTLLVPVLIGFVHRLPGTVVANVPLALRVKGVFRLLLAVSSSASQGGSSIFQCPTTGGALADRVVFKWSSSIPSSTNASANSSAVAAARSSTRPLAKYWQTKPNPTLNAALYAMLAPASWSASSVTGTPLCAPLTSSTTFADSVASNINVVAVLLSTINGVSVPHFVNQNSSTSEFVDHVDSSSVSLPLARSAKVTWVFTGRFTGVSVIYVELAGASASSTTTRTIFSQRITALTTTTFSAEVESGADGSLTLYLAFLSPVQRGNAVDARSPTFLDDRRVAVATVNVVTIDRVLDLTSNATQSAASVLLAYAALLRKIENTTISTAATTTLANLTTITTTTSPNVTAPPATTTAASTNTTLAPASTPSSNASSGTAVLLARLADNYANHMNNTVVMMVSATGALNTTYGVRFSADVSYPPLCLGDRTGDGRCRCAASSLLASSYVDPGMLQVNATRSSFQTSTKNYSICMILGSTTDVFATSWNVIVVPAPLFIGSVALFQGNSVRVLRGASALALSLTFATAPALPFEATDTISVFAVAVAFVPELVSIFGISALTTETFDCTMLAGTQVMLSRRLNPAVIAFNASAPSTSGAITGVVVGLLNASGLTSAAPSVTSSALCFTASYRVTQQMLDIHESLTTYFTLTEPSPALVQQRITATSPLFINSSAFVSSVGTTLKFLTLQVDGIAASGVSPTLSSSTLSNATSDASVTPIVLVSHVANILYWTFDSGAIVVGLKAGLHRQACSSLPISGPGKDRSEVAGVSLVGVNDTCATMSIAAGGLDITVNASSAVATTSSSEAFFYLCLQTNDQDAYTTVGPIVRFADFSKSDDQPLIGPTSNADLFATGLVFASTPRRVVFLAGSNVGSGCFRLHPLTSLAENCLLSAERRGRGIVGLGGGSGVSFTVSRISLLVASTANATLGAIGYLALTESPASTASTTILASLAADATPLAFPGYCLSVHSGTCASFVTFTNTTSNVSSSFGDHLPSLELTRAVKIAQPLSVSDWNYFNIVPNPNDEQQQRIVSFVGVDTPIVILTRVAATGLTSVPPFQYLVLQESGTTGGACPKELPPSSNNRSFVLPLTARLSAGLFQYAVTIPATAANLLYLCCVVQSATSAAGSSGSVEAIGVTLFTVSMKIGLQPLGSGGSISVTQGESPVLSIEGTNFDVAILFASVSDSRTCTPPHEGFSTPGVSRVPEPILGCGGIRGTVAVSRATSLTLDSPLYLCIAGASRNDGVSTYRVMSFTPAGITYEVAAASRLSEFIPPPLKTLPGSDEFEYQPQLKLISSTGVAIQNFPSGLIVKAKWFIISPTQNETTEEFNVTVPTGAATADFTSSSRQVVLRPGFYGFQYQLEYSVVGAAIASLRSSVVVEKGPCQSAGEYAVAYSTRCEQCPPHAICNGDMVFKLEESYWRASNITPFIYDCGPPFGASMCRANTSMGSNPCKEGHIGVRCTACDNGYGYSLDQCVICDPNVANSYALVAATGVGLLVIVFALVAMTVGSTQSWRHTILFKQVVSHLVLASTVGEFGSNVPKIMLRFFDGMKSTSRPSPNFAAMDCSLRPTYYQRFAGALLLPFPVLLVALVFSLVTYVRRYRADKKENEKRNLFRERLRTQDATLNDDLLALELKRSRAYDRDVAQRFPAWQVLISASVVIVFLLFPSMVEECVNTLKCDDLQVGEPHPDDVYSSTPGVIRPRIMSVFSFDRRLLCTDSLHVIVQRVAIAVGLLWGVGVPILAVVLVIVMERRVGFEASRRLFFFIINGFRGSRWYWESVNLLRKASMLTLRVFIRDTRLQSYSAMWLLGFFLALQVYFDPFSDRVAARLEVLSLAVVVVTVNFSLLFEYAPPTSNDPLLFGLATALTAFLMSINILTLVLFAYFIVTDYVVKVKRGIVENRDKIPEAIRAFALSLAADEVERQRIQDQETAEQEDIERIVAENKLGGHNAVLQLVLAGPTSRVAHKLYLDEAEQREGDDGFDDVHLNDAEQQAPKSDVRVDDSRTQRNVDIGRRASVLREADIGCGLRRRRKSSVAALEPGRSRDPWEFVKMREVGTTMSLDRNGASEPPSSLKSTKDDFATQQGDIDDDGKVGGGEDALMMTGPNGRDTAVDVDATAGPDVAVLDDDKPDVYKTQSWRSSADFYDFAKASTIPSDAPLSAKSDSDDDRPGDAAARRDSLAEESTGLDRESARHDGKNTQKPTSARGRRLQRLELQATDAPLHQQEPNDYFQGRLRKASNRKSISSDDTDSDEGGRSGGGAPDAGKEGREDGSSATNHHQQDHNGGGASGPHRRSHAKREVASLRQQLQISHIELEQLQQKYVQLFTNSHEFASLVARLRDEKVQASEENAALHARNEELEAEVARLVLELAEARGKIITGNIIVPGSPAASARNAPSHPTESHAAPSSVKCQAETSSSSTVVPGSRPARSQPPRAPATLLSAVGHVGVATSSSEPPPRTLPPGDLLATNSPSRAAQLERAFQARQEQRSLVMQFYAPQPADIQHRQALKMAAEAEAARRRWEEAAAAERKNQAAHLASRVTEKISKLRERRSVSAGSPVGPTVHWPTEDQIRGMRPSRDPGSPTARDGHPNFVGVESSEGPGGQPNEEERSVARAGGIVPHRNAFLFGALRTAHHASMPTSHWIVPSPGASASVAPAEGPSIEFRANDLRAASSRPPPQM